MDLEKLDRRTLERMLARLEVTQEVVAKAARALPDLADAVASPSEEDLEKLAQKLTAERSVREERIERALERAASPAERIPQGPVQPFDEDDL